MLGEPKAGGNPKGNYEEEARVPRGFPGEASRAPTVTQSNDSISNSKNPLRQSLIGEKIEKRVFPKAHHMLGSPQRGPKRSLRPPQWSSPIYTNSRSTAKRPLYLQLLLGKEHTSSSHVVQSYIYTLIYVYITPLKGCYIYIYIYYDSLMTL